MAEVLVHPELEVSFAYSESFGAYVATTTGGFFTLDAGQKYVVYWDDERCERTSFDFIFSDGSECVGIGNPLAAGQASNDDKFCIVYDKTHEMNHFLSLEQSDAHKVSIYKITEDEDDDEPTEPEQPEGIVLKDRNGEDVAYYGIETVTFDTTTEGKQQVYTKGVAVDGLEIVPDFSGGDMAVTAPAGTLVRSAAIKKPSTQTPENIRRGVNMGGVVGEFIGDTEEVIVDLNMAYGDQIIVPTAPGKVISQVTVRKPDTFLEENIAAGVNIAGVVGRLSAGTSAGAGVIYTLDDSGEVVEAALYGLTMIPNAEFARKQYLTSVDLSGCEVITKIGMQAFQNCTALTSFDIPDTVTELGQQVFWGATLSELTIPASVKSMGSYLVYQMTSLKKVFFEDPDGWKVKSSETATSSKSVDVTDPEQAATLLTSTYANYFWVKT